MTQRELERELCRATGESIRTVRARGFSLVQTPQHKPLEIDWDERFADRVAMLPNRSASR